MAVQGDNPATSASMLTRSRLDRDDSKEPRFINIHPS
ncbi:hypothetical protein IL54_0035 [Sphingobium sp. ba1]|nr:hypothetical protein IL54_0035 [Sphingobium sp. ba1]